MPAGLKRVFVTPLDAVDTSDKEGVGTIRREGNKTYKYVKLQNVTATVAVADGDVVSYRADQYDTHHVVSDATDADAAPIAAGVTLATIAGVAGTAYYVWIQIQGHKILLQALAGTPVAGDELVASTTDKTATRRTYAGTTPAIVPNGSLLGVVQHVTNKDVILRCPQ